MEFAGVAMIIVAATMFYVICAPLSFHNSFRGMLGLQPKVCVEAELPGVKYKPGDDEVSWDEAEDVLWYAVHIEKADGIHRTRVLKPTERQYTHEDLKTAKRIQVQYGTEYGLSENPPVYVAPTPIPASPAKP